MTERAEPLGAPPVAVPCEVTADIEALRTSGATNMLARDVVARLAEEFGFEERARWVRLNPGL